MNSFYGEDGENLVAAQKKGDAHNAVARIISVFASIGMLASSIAGVYSAYFVAAGLPGFFILFLISAACIKQDPIPSHNDFVMTYGRKRYCRSGSITRR